MVEGEKLVEDRVVDEMPAVIAAEETEVEKMEGGVTVEVAMVGVEKGPAERGVNEKVVQSGIEIGGVCAVCAWVRTGVVVQLRRNRGRQIVAWQIMSIPLATLRCK